jgi:CBS domain containing-hemolysin-like protein
MVTGLIVAVVLVLANGFFVAAEFVLPRIRPIQVQELALSGGAAARWLRCAVDRLDVCRIAHAAGAQTG